MLSPETLDVLRQRWKAAEASMRQRRFKNAGCFLAAAGNADDHPPAKPTVHEAVDEAGSKRA